MLSPDWLQPILDWLQANPTWAGVIIFAVAMCESLLVVGVLVPGALIMLAFGALIAMGAIGLWSTLLWAIAGAIVGDGISFWIGYYFKDRLKTAWPFNKHPQMLARGEAFFLKHGGKSVVLGRFVGPVRAVIPTVAGIMGMTPRRFTIINVLSAIAWAPTYILPGAAVGASLGLASQVATRFGLLVFGFIIFLLIVAWLIKRIFRAIQPHAQAILTRLLSWASKHPLAGQFVTPLIDPKQPEVGSLALFATLLLTSSWLFSILFVNAYTSNYIISIDEAVYSLFQDLRSPWMDSIMISLSQLGDSNVTIPMTIAITLYLALQNQLKAAAYWIAALAFAFISTLALKSLLGIPRPSPMYDGLSMFSFPSGHATVNMVMYGFLAVITAHMTPNIYRWIPYTISGITICAIALSRVYLGAHWLSDVLGGLSLGVLWVTLLGTAYQRHCPPVNQLLHFSGLTAAILILAGSLHILLNHQRETQRYTPVVSYETLETDHWWQDGWQTLSAHRVDIKKQHSNHPMTLQWAGKLSSIEHTLAQQDWKVAPRFSIASSLLWLSPEAQINNLPILPQAHNGQHEALLMKKQLEDSSRLLILRLWKSSYTLDSEEPIYSGYIAELALKHSGLFTHLEQKDNYQQLLTYLPETLASWHIQHQSRDSNNPVTLIKVKQIDEK